jgi:2-(1,2-epoxy-1,2-dihydrophenyl)acetyl-CoA isomerase
MSPPKLLLERAGTVLTLVLNRPDKRNAIDNELADRLLDGLRLAAADPGTRVIRLRGNGRAFCAGRDISSPPTDRDLELVQAISREIVAIPKPVVAAVHGWTVGAGLEWMMNADIVFAAQGSRFKLPEAQLGVFVTGGLVATLPATVGLNRAKALMLMGNEFNAMQALEWGIAIASPPDALLDGASLEGCARLAALSPQVAAEFKRVLNRVGLAGFEAAVQEECDAQRRLGAASQETPDN